MSLSLFLLFWPSVALATTADVASTAIASTDANSATTTAADVDLDA